MRKITILIALALAGISVSGHAAAVVIQNFSFENAGLGDGGFTGSTGVDGFTFLGAGAENSTNDKFAGTTGTPGTLPSPADGVTYAFLNGGDGNYMYQNVGALLADTTYTFTIALGNRLDQNIGGVTLSLLNGNDNTGTLLASAVSVLTPAEGTFSDFTLQFTTGSVASGNLTILIQNSFGSGDPNSIDNVRLDATAVPEPSSFALLAVGALAFLGVRRFQKGRVEVKVS